MGLLFFNLPLRNFIVSHSTRLVILKNCVTLVHHNVVILHQSLNSFFFNFTVT
jgi:hypothetical protein